MHTEQRKDSDYQVARQRYIRVQIVGMSIFLATWPGIMMISMFNLKIRGDIFAVLMVVVAVIIFAIGHYGKQELKEHG